MGRAAAFAYRDAPFSNFLAPKRFNFWDDWIWGFVKRYRTRFWLSNQWTYVAESKPGGVIGVTQFSLQGKGSGEDSLWNRLVRWFWKRVDSRTEDRSENHENARSMGKFDVGYRAIYGTWGTWLHVDSLVVVPWAQRRGVGVKLMEPILETARKLNKVVLLESSAPGETLYRKVGFELITRYVDGEGNLVQEGGGLMVWRPEGFVDPEEVARVPELTKAARALQE